MEAAAGQCVTAASVSEECKKILPDYPVADVEAMLKGDVFTYITSIAYPACAERLIAARVCEQQMAPMTNSLESCSEDGLALRKHIETLSSIVLTQTQPAMQTLARVIEEGFRKERGERDLDLRFMSLMSMPATFTSVCRLAQLFQASSQTYIIL